MTGTPGPRTPAEGATEEHDHSEFRQGGDSLLPRVSDAAESYNVAHIRSQSDLPAVSNGRHQLEDMTVYWFHGFVDSPYGLELGYATPLIGSHGGADGFIHTGGSVAVAGQDVPYLSRNLYYHAPGGTIYDIAGTSEEVLVESVSMSDAAGLGDIANLGTFDGMRVPSFKSVNFENFQAGLTFTGNPDKVFFSDCPFRNVSTSNVRVLTFDSGFEADIVDMTDDYVKGMESDTEVVYVDPDAVIDDIFQYRGVTHDSSVTRGNILAGAASSESVDFRVRDSYPLADSKAYIDYTLDGAATVTISTQAASKTDTDAYVRVGASTVDVGSSRFSHQNNLATYVGKRNTSAELSADVSLGTGTSDEVAVAWFKNGSILAGTPMRVQMNQQGGGVAKALSTTGLDDNMAPNDEFDIRVANLGSTTDIDVGELTAQIGT